MPPDTLTVAAWSWPRTSNRAWAKSIIGNASSVFFPHGAHYTESLPADSGTRLGQSINTQSMVADTGGHRPASPRRTSRKKVLGRRTTGPTRGKNGTIRKNGTIVLLIQYRESFVILCCCSRTGPEHGLLAGGMGVQTSRPEDLNPTRATRHERMCCPERALGA